MESISSAASISMTINNPFLIGECNNRLARFMDDKPRLRILLPDGEVETLTQDEAEMMQEAMFIEYCEEHKGFHLVLQEVHCQDASNWLREWRKDRAGF